MPNIHAVIMAGGRGERFWPLSTEDAPKPFLRLLGTSTLLQDAVSRLVALVPPENILISIGRAQLAIAQTQLPGLRRQNFIVEPMGRDTAACLGYAALHIERRDPEAVMLALPADHFIADGDAYLRTLRAGAESLAGASGIVFGIAPARPETGYGYIQAEKPGVPAAAWPVIRFVEKPDAATAARYLRAGNFFWNSGIFLWENGALLEMFGRFMPRTGAALSRLRPMIGRDETGAEQERIFESIERISIDYGIIEKVSGLRMIPAEFGWDDIGNWASLERALPPRACGNVAHGPFRSVDARGNISYSDAGTVAIFGVSNLVVVHAGGKTLVCPKERAGDLKDLVKNLRD